MGFLSKLSGADKQDRAMAEVARQVLTIMAMGNREGVVMINTLKFPHVGAPQLTLQPVTDYLTSNGVAVIDMDYQPDARLGTYRVQITESFEVTTFGQEYMQYISG
jgi:hypothetical protein